MKSEGIARVLFAAASLSDGVEEGELLRVIQVVPRIHEEASGPSYSVPRLTEALSAQGAEVCLHVLTPLPPVKRSCSVRAYPAWPLPMSLGISPAMRAVLREEAASTDVIHNHGLWMMPNVYPAWAVRGRDCRLVTSPRGTLAPWALRHSRYRKRLMWWLCQGRAVRASHCFHATAESEYEDIRGVGLRGPVAVIPNGIDIPPLGSAEHVSSRRRLLFLSRIHPKKGLDQLLQAWRKVQDKCPEWELHIVGPDDGGHQSELERLGASLGVERVAFPGPVYGSDKSKMFRSAELFILPTYAENFGMAVAEALAHAVPAIVTKGAPWAGLETHRCGWWVEQGVESLSSCLSSVLKMTASELRAGGERGRQWMDKEYSWDGVGRMMLETYRWLVGGGTPPAWVQTN